MIKYCKRVAASVLILSIVMLCLLSPIHATQLHTCPLCNGLGTDGTTISYCCNRCGGLGVVNGNHCYTCRGSGVVVKEAPCDECGGAGMIEGYLVTYDSNGGSNAPISQIKRDAEALTLSNKIPAMMGCKFVGWSVERFGEVVYQPGDTYTENDDLTLFAVWRVLCSDCNGQGAEQSKQRCSKCDGDKYYDGKIDCSTCYGYGILMSEVTYRCPICLEFDWAVPDPNCYSCKGTGKVSYSTGDACPVCDGTGKEWGAIYCNECIDGYVYTDISCDSCNGQGTINAWIVSYDPNGGTDAPSHQFKLAQQSLTLSDRIPSRYGFSFVGWGLSADGEAIYAPQATYNLDAHMMLFAIWEPLQEFSIIYDANGGTYSQTSQTKYLGQEVCLYGTAPQREGYRFIGWSKFPCGQAMYQPYDYFYEDADTVLYAIWQEICPECTGDGCENCSLGLRPYAPTHNYNQGIITEEPTCSLWGTMTYQCAVCGGEKIESVAPLGHDFGSWQIGIAPTCEKNGTQIAYCNRCSIGTMEELPATGHNYILDEIIQPTCTEYGFTKHICTSCNRETHTDIVDPLGHNYACELILPPTCTNEGTEKLACDRCDAEEYREVPALGHTESDWFVKVEPSCIDAGYKVTECVICETRLQTEMISPLGHNYIQEATTPTCTETGFITHTCVNCADSYVDSYTDALGHAWDDGVITVIPTTTKEGMITYTCTRCAQSKTEILPKEERCDGGADCPSLKFRDVNTNDWFHEYVDFVVSNGLFGGMSANTFEPDTAMTRAMLVTVLWRYAGTPIEGANTFVDVASNQWYSNAVAWAAHNGIVGGVGNNKFDPNGNITREQMATILYRYAGANGLDTSARADLDIFPDGELVSDYANHAIRWAVAEGLINGTDGKLLPQGNATRAQVATILMRFIDNVAN